MAQVRIVVYDDENREVSAHDIARVKNLQLAKDMAEGLARRLAWFKKQEHK